MPPCPCRYRRSGHGVAGEGEVTEVRVRGEGCTRFGTAARHDIEDARRETGGLHECGDPQRGQRRRTGGFEDHRVAGTERWADLPRRNQDRHIPRDDGAAYPDRLPADEGVAVGGQRHRLAPERPRYGVVILENIRTPPHLASCFVEGFSLLRRQGEGEFVQMGPNQPGRPAQYLSPLPRVHPAPGVPRRRRRIERTVDILRGARRDIIYRRTGRGVENRNPFAAGRIHRSAAHSHLHT